MLFSKSTLWAAEFCRVALASGRNLGILQRVPQSYHCGSGREDPQSHNWMKSASIWTQDSSCRSPPSSWLQFPFVYMAHEMKSVDMLCLGKRIDMDIALWGCLRSVYWLSLWTGNPSQPGNCQASFSFFATSARPVINPKHTDLKTQAPHGLAFEEYFRNVCRE